MGDFSEARRICEEMDSTVVEPTTFEEGNIVWSMVDNFIPIGESPWINYHDMEMKASLIGTEEDAVLADSKYMGSLTTLDQLPEEWWSPNAFTGMEPYELEKYNCLQWS